MVFVGQNRVSNSLVIYVFAFLAVDPVVVLAEPRNLRLKFGRNRASC